MKSVRTSAPGIYSITHITSGKLYVGSAVNCGHRWSEHRKRLRRNCHHSVFLQRAWNKHGEDAFVFSLIERVCDLTTLIAREQHWIDSLSSAKKHKGYNIAPVAGNTLGVKHTEEARIKIRVARARQVITDEHRRNISLGLMGRTPSTKSIARIGALNRGRHLSDETKAKLSMAMSGRKPSPEHIEHIRASLRLPGVLAKMSRLGMKHTEAAKRKISNAGIGRHPSAETRAKISASHTGITFTDERRANISAGRRKYFLLRTA